MNPMEMLMQILQQQMQLAEQEQQALNQMSAELAALLPPFGENQPME